MAVLPGVARAAVIDLGTNTFHLLIADLIPGNIRKIYQAEVPVKLGQGGINRGIILDEPYQRGLSTLHDFHHTITELEATTVKGTATSAIRSASNGADFIRDVLTQTGIAIEVISGDREAELICKGVRKAVRFSHEPALIMDIGGGSVEFIIADENRICWKQSFNIGASRLLETYHRTDPIPPGTIQKLAAYLEQTLQPLFEAAKEYKPRCLIGSAGAFDSFTQMTAWRFNKPELLNETSFRFDPVQFNRLHDVLIASTLEERLQMKGLASMRADMIVVSVIMTRFVMNRLNLEELHYSAYALKEGLLAELAEELHTER